jgi:hypothetical protein
MDFRDRLDAVLWPEELILTEGLGGALSKFFKSFLEPIVTFTGGGGPGVGVRIRGTPFAVDIDPTGPGTGVLLPTEIFASILRKIPLSYTRNLADKVAKIPGQAYIGVELIGLVPVPFPGAAAATDDAKKLVAFFRGEVEKAGTPAKLVKKSP